MVMSFLSLKMTTAQVSVSLPKFFLLLLHFLSACLWDQAWCSPGSGLKQWQKSLASSSHQNRSLYLHESFPTDFLWGVGTSAYQTEGSWNQDGKGLSIWDQFTHTRQDHAGTADTSSDSYAQWEKDMQAVKYLGTQTYAFSLSWPRLFPNGIGSPNPDGVAHYQRLISRFQAEGIEPVVTLYHWDLPLVLQEFYGGWKNDSTVEAFVEYATFCFQTFGGSVKYWLTMHNPYLVAVQGYGTGVHAPGESHDPAATFLVGHNLIKAHAKVWHVYNTHFRPHQNGQVSLTLGSHWIEPFNGKLTPANVQLCQKSMEAVIGWFAGPIHSTGDYPASLKDSNQGLIPEFSTEERAFVRGTADFFSLSFGPDILRMGQRLPLFGQMLSMDLRKVLGWIQQEYDNPAVLVAESGWFTDVSVREEDTLAIYVMRRLLDQVLEAVTYDNAQVFGYTAWSLVDGFEWNFGYTIRRGLFYVDFNDTDRNRIPKTSAEFYRQVVMNNGFSGTSSENIKGQFPCDFQWGVADPVLHVRLHPYSAQFIDPNLYRWNFSGDGSLRPVAGVTLHTRGAQCTDFLSIRRHLHLLEMTRATHYRFALDWALLLPDGDPSHVDQEAFRYYHCFLIELHKLGVKATVTLYHSSHRSPSLGMPKPLQAAGGWLNRSTIEAFEAYATFSFQELSPWVHTWITINEPNRLAELYNRSTEEHLTVAHHLLLAHARVWHIYNDQYRPQHGAQVTFTLHADWVEPANPYVETHRAAVKRFLLFELGWFLDPFLADGGGKYPEQVRGYIEEMAYTSGSESATSSLPHFTEQEKQIVSGALDFIALNHFTTRLVSPKSSLLPSAKNGGSNQHHGVIHGCSFLNDPNWHVSYLGQAVVPWGLRKVLNWVKSRYGDARPIVVMASGVDDQASHDDKLRQTYVREYLQEALKAREQDGIDLRGFYVWNLQDRHTFHFGLFAPTHYESHPKGSVKAYQEIISHRGFPSRDGGTQTSCQLPIAQAYTCSLCTKISENKPLLFFGICVFISVAVLAAVLVGLLRGKLSVGGRRRAANPMSPQRISKQCWERFAMQRVVRRL